MKQQVIAITALFLMSGVVIGGMVGMSHVLATDSNTSSQQESADEPENNSDKPDFTSSVRVSDTSEVDEATEVKQLRSVVKISEAQAKAAAEKNAGGVASSVKLENENGNVLYAVVVGDKEFKVDAGNGSILQVEAVDTKDSQDPSDKSD